MEPTLSAGTDSSLPGLSEGLGKRLHIRYVNLCALVNFSLFGFLCLLNEPCHRGVKIRALKSL